MSTKTVITCDIEKCNSEDRVKSKHLDVVFLTEQTEGRSCSPYISSQKIDICISCLTKLVRDKRYIVGSGAMGHNTYTL